MSTNGFWRLKYEPKTLAEMVLHPDIRIKLENVLNNTPHTILYGKPGVGKSLFAKILVNSFNSDFLHLNAADERKIETVREKVIPFINSSFDAFFKVKKFIIFNEADQLTEDAQRALHEPLEYAEERNCVCIFLTNHIDKIDDPIRSRCYKVHIKDFPYDDVIKFMKKILKAEKIKFQDKQLGDFIKPDMRNIIINLQNSCKDGKLLSN